MYSYWPEDSELCWRQRILQCMSRISETTDSKRGGTLVAYMYASLIPFLLRVLHSQDIEIHLRPFTFNETH